MTRSKTLSFVALVILALPLPRSWAEAVELEVSLRNIDMQRRGHDTDCARLERECLAMLDVNRSPGETGRIFAQIAVVYSQAGLTQPEKAAQYAEKALQHPLDPGTAGQMYVFWADALQVTQRGLTGHERALAQQHVATVALRGLKFILESGVPDQRQPLPIVNLFDHDGPADNGVHSQLVKKQEDELLARKRVMHLNDLVHHRDALVDKIAHLYSRDPLAMDTLGALALDIVGDDRIRNRLMNRIRKRIDYIRERDLPESE